MAVVAARPIVALSRCGVAPKTVQEMPGAPANDAVSGRLVAGAPAAPKEAVPVGTAFDDQLLGLLKSEVVPFQMAFCASAAGPSAGPASSKVANEARMRFLTALPPRR